MQNNQATYKQIQGARHTGKMLLELKRSVGNVYRNFEDVLKLQEDLKDRYESHC